MMHMTLQKINYLKLEDLKIGMVITDDQVRSIYNTYILLANPELVEKDDEDVIQGTIVFIGREQNEECAKAFKENVINNTRPCIIYNTIDYEAEGIYCDPEA